MKKNLKIGIATSIAILTIGASSLILDKVETDMKMEVSKKLSELNMEYFNIESKGSFLNKTIIINNIEGKENGVSTLKIKKAEIDMFSLPVLINSQKEENSSKKGLVDSFLMEAYSGKVLPIKLTQVEILDKTIYQLSINALLPMFIQTGNQEFTEKFLSSLNSGSNVNLFIKYDTGVNKMNHDIKIEMPFINSSLTSSINYDRELSEKATVSGYNTENIVFNHIKFKYLNADKEFFKGMVPEGYMDPLVNDQEVIDKINGMSAGKDSKMLIEIINKNKLTMTDFRNGLAKAIHKDKFIDTNLTISIK